MMYKSITVSHCDTSGWKDKKKMCNKKRKYLSKENILKFNQIYIYGGKKYEEWFT